MAKCLGCQEKEASRLECPTCKKLGIPNSFFCDQACFKRSWPTHKNLHALVSSITSTNLSQSTEDAERDRTLPEHLRGYKYTGRLRPVYPLSPKRVVPAGIERPDYADQRKGESMCEMRSNGRIKPLDAEEVERMRTVCRLAREVLDHTASHVRPGITTDELDAICHAAIIERGAYPSPLNYRNFPKSVCTSVNEVICHGIPDQRPLEEGDIINLDVTLFYGGMHGDLNATYPVGKIDKESADLIAATEESMLAAIALCRPGALYRDIGNKIESIIKPKGYSIVRQYTGHGINQLFHTVPNIVHYGNSKMPGKMEVGHCFTIEPMINMGVASLDHWRDDWTAVTKDGKKSAQFEETMVVTETGVEVLTRPGMSFP